MTQAVNADQQRLQHWLNRVTALVDQVRDWSRAQGWVVEDDQKRLHEEALGTYRVPVLRIAAPGGGTLHLNPVALHVVGGDGRVDLEAFPTLSRVKLVGANGGWTVMTDSNVPLRQPWSEATFVQLAADLLS